MAGACGSDNPAVEPTPPGIESAAVAAGMHNVLHAVVTVSLHDADSVAVRYGLVGAPLDSMTPVSIAHDSQQLDVLGLLPGTAYHLQVIAYGNDLSASSDTLEFTTGNLPADLPAYQAGGTDPSPGFVAFAANTYGIVIDNTGRVVWYRQLPGGMTLNFQPQPTGRYLTHPVTAAADDADTVGGDRSRRRDHATPGMPERVALPVSRHPGRAGWKLLADVR